MFKMSSSASSVDDGNFAFFFTHLVSYDAKEERGEEEEFDIILLCLQVVQQLPPPHFRTLEYLTRHLARVAENNGSTGMTAKNVAIVWAPNLLRCKELEFGGVAALQVRAYRTDEMTLPFLA